MSGKAENHSTDVLELKELLLLIARQLVPAVTGKDACLRDVEEGVYDLCNMARTIDQMAVALKKPANTVRKSLTRLKKKGLVCSARCGGRVLYTRLSPPRRILDEKGSMVDAGEG